MRLRVQIEGINNNGESFESDSAVDSKEDMEKFLEEFLHTSKNNYEKASIQFYYCDCC